MATVSICFSTDPKSLVSRIIRWFTKSKCSHAFLLVEGDPTFGTLIVESDGSGVQITTAARFDFARNPIIKQFHTAEDLLPALRACMDAELGWKYDYTGLVGMAWVEFWRWFKKKVSNPLHAPKHLFCSAFVITVLQKAAFPGANTLDASSTDAQMLWDFLDATPAPLFV